MKINGLLLLMLGVWLGMLLGISFLEAPLKFRAPNMTIALGLGIGQLVFSALNKVEMIFSALLLFWLYLNYKSLSTSLIICLMFIIVAIILQSIWLLPILNLRVDKMLQGMETPKTYHHLCYVAIEIVKVALLFLSFIKLYPNE